MFSASDADLLAAIADGDRVVAVGILYDRHGPAVWTAALHALGDHRQAEAVTIAVFAWMTRHAARLAAAPRPLSQVLAVECARARLELGPGVVLEVRPPSTALLLDPA
jgi:hypothetical protein